jgi:hypothetical protein
MFAHWAERREVARVEGIGGLLPSEDGITARALQAIQNQDAQHVRLLQEQIRRLAPIRPRGGRH